MSTTFIHHDFLLESEQAKRLYHEHAQSLPIIDYHSHLPPSDLAENRNFRNLTHIWLSGDHYKWRAMRASGVDERFITGGASDWEKFEKWAQTVPKTLRNPLYHWTHLELNRPFGINDRLLDGTSARGIWDECNSKLATAGFSTIGILNQLNVEVVCTTDDPIDDLRFHKAHAAKPNASPRMYPTFRPDKAVAVENPATFVAYVEELGVAADTPIRNYADFIYSLQKRHEYFHENGCRLSDHGLETLFAEEYNDIKVAACFDTLLRGGNLEPSAALEFKSAVLYELAVMDQSRGWVQQYHLGALRDRSTRMLRTLGSNTGFDSIGDFEIARPLSRFLDRLDTENKLAKTILYNANPRDNELVASMIGSFQDGSVPGKVQYGAAWWFLDQMDGIERQLEALSNMGLLSQFVGMLTDSRSFLSYPRHEYFRRILCNVLGSEMSRGLLPDDIGLVGKLVGDICYYNAKRFFEFPQRD
jgi:glucuronate isomerase